MRGLLTASRKAVGRSFYGWKGGEFVMGERTPLWADKPGETECRGILGLVLEPPNTVVIRTHVVDEYTEIW